MSKAKDSKPLGLPNTLRDLARLRASDFDLCSLLSSKTQSANPAGSLDPFVEESYVFAQEARGVLRLHNRSDLVTLDGRVEDVRNRLDDLVTGLDTRDATCEFSLTCTRKIHLKVL